MILKKELSDVLTAYGVVDYVAGVQAYGNGHINDTHLVTLRDVKADSGFTKLIIQKINTSIFKNPVHLMENITQVTQWIQNKIEARGGDVMREALCIVPTKEGDSYFITDEGSYYRAYVFIDGGVCLDKARTPKDLYESGMGFGGFQRCLADFPAENLHETIPDFHNTVKRLEAFKHAVAEDVCNLAASVQSEIDFALSMEEKVTYCAECKKNLPLRVTHNDTKLNNVMLDSETEKALCVLDLDTVMPGYAMDDFGDGIRVGANTALEDEKDLSKVSCDLSLFRAFTEGFLKGTEGSLTKEEIELLPLGALIMAYECGIRFLMDYLQGNVYFKVMYPEHNLVRARNQFALVKDINKKMVELNQIMVEFAKM